MRHALLLIFASACIRTMAANRASDAIVAQGDTFASDDDPELVRAASPFGLKITESLLDTLPARGDLLVSAASGFTQYAYAFVQQEADFDEPVSLERAHAEYERARRLYKRATAYGLRALDAAHAGTSEKLKSDAAAALAPMTKADVPALYWTAAPWVARIVLSKNDAALIGDLGTVEALMARALALDEAWDDGAIHEFFEAFEASRPGADPKAAREKAAAHRDRALALCKGQKIGPLVTWAEDVDVAAQDKKEFDGMIALALAFDADSAPHYRLVNLILQRRARWLSSRAEELFVDGARHASPVAERNACCSPF